MLFAKMVRDYLGAYSGQEEGQGMVEYALVVGTISIVIVGAFLTGTVQQGITAISNTIGTSLGATPTT